MPLDTIINLQKTKFLKKGVVSGFQLSRERTGTKEHTSAQVGKK